MVPLEFYERAVQLLPDRGVAAVCPETHEFKAVNDAYAEILETSPSALVGTTWISHTVEEDVGYDLGLVAEVVDGKRESYILTKRYKTRTGKIVPVMLLVAKYPPHGPIELLVAIVTDESEGPVSPALITQLQTDLKELRERLVEVEASEAILKAEKTAQELGDFKRAMKIVAVAIPTLAALLGGISWILERLF